VSGVGQELRKAVADFAAKPRVLVAVDFDGTLAPFVTDPLQARALPGGLEALKAAAALDGVTVALVSGRDLATLATLTGFGPDDGVGLIGSHGAQTSLGDSPSPGDQRAPDLLDGQARARLEMLHGELAAIASRHPGVRLERKPAAVALHTRGVESSVASAALADARELGARTAGVHVMPGKDVVELAVLEADKGSAVVNLARATGSDATLYVGDDVTDERAFAALNPASGDLTVKVGDGESAAIQRIPDPQSAVELLKLFVDERDDRRHG
jgi:trehalose 6-phosphate phosphatase